MGMIVNTLGIIFYKKSTFIDIGASCFDRLSYCYFVIRGFPIPLNFTLTDILQLSFLLVLDFIFWVVLVLIILSLVRYFRKKNQQVVAK